MMRGPRRWPAFALSAALGLGVLLAGSIHPHATTSRAQIPAAGGHAATVDHQPPTVRPLVLTMHTPGPRGTVVPAGLATAKDDDGTPVRADCTPGVGTPVDVGDTSVVCTATDRAGNVGYATWDLTVVLDPATAATEPAARAPHPAPPIPRLQPAVLAPTMGLVSATPAPAEAGVRPGAHIPLTGSLAVATGLAVLGTVLLLAGATGLGSMPRP